MYYYCSFDRMLWWVPCGASQIYTITRVPLLLIHKKRIHNFLYFYIVYRYIRGLLIFSDIYL